MPRRYWPPRRPITLQLPAAMHDALDAVAERENERRGVVHRGAVRRTDVIRRYIVEGLMRDSEEDTDVPSDR
jgi:hypothetical protein